MKCEDRHPVEWFRTALRPLPLVVLCCLSPGCSDDAEIEPVLTPCIDCECTSQSIGVTRPCAIDNIYGNCGGIQTCFAAGSKAEWGSCDAATPAAETCNGLDDDCDGAVDEDFVTAQGAFTLDEHCGACGRSCTGAVPNGVAACDGASDVPRCVVIACDPGYRPVGTTQCVPASLGLCDPCAGAENCQLPGAACLPFTDGSFCATACTGAADCPAGFDCVDPGTGTTHCLPATNACNCVATTVGAERACSVGATDGSGAEYACYGVQSCGADGWSACVLPAEICNGVDDNCDGVVDEGFVDGTGRYVDDQNCGACGHDCGALMVAGATATCNDAVDPPLCSVSCEGTCVDLNEDPRDGCECCEPQLIDLPDAAGIDTNCDSVDGEVANAIFVATHGDDGQPGTRLQPKRHIQSGIDAAATAGLRDVYVASGRYQQQLSLVAGVAVYGGYATDFSTRDPTRMLTLVVPPRPLGPLLPGTINCSGISGGAPGSTVLDGFVVFGAAEQAVGLPSYGVHLHDCDASVRLTHNRVIGGSGGSGITGADGVDGSDGAPGTSGLDAVDLRTTYSSLTPCASPAGCTAPETCVFIDTQTVCALPAHVCDAASDPSLYDRAGGAGGFVVCNGIDVSGGDGGLRTCPLPNDYAGPSGAETWPPTVAEAGGDGLPGAAAGGAAGRDVWQQAYLCTGYEAYAAVAGGDGASGAPGQPGDGGNGCTNPAGSVVGDRWVMASAGGGGDGTYGEGGGGGGSGAGARAHDSCAIREFGYDNIGGSGGGGGSGGCGGTGGEPGTSGGAALGIFVCFTSAPTTLPHIADNSIEGGSGGHGGDGGAGGIGANGGGGVSGGLPGGIVNPPSVTYPAFGGGRGGDGGPGGHGGGGGGGCGGPVFGLFLSGQGGLDLPTWSSDNIFALGLPGAGGLDGITAGADPGGSGEDGVAQEVNF